SSASTISKPLLPSSPSMISLSTRFLGQPRLIMPTRRGVAAGTAGDGASGRRNGSALMLMREKARKEGRTVGAARGSAEAEEGWILTDTAGKHFEGSYNRRPERNDD